MKPFSQACENNKQPILDILQRVFADRERVLEIGSGTGQHAVFFAANLPHLYWQTSDLAENHAGIRQWIGEARLPNLAEPITIDADQQPWPVESVDAIFTANTFHIMSWPQVQRTFEGIARILQPGGVLAVYGPFNYNGEFTSESNRNFDAWLKQRGAHQGIRDFEAVNELAKGIGLDLQEDNAMPANNRLLVWKRR
jgi:cyclopropane fatty-acyl-phospholipid synthase-like methyltransferase